MSICSRSTRPLAEAVAANGGASAAAGTRPSSAALGFGGDGGARAALANENTPKLRTFDARGNRRDEVEFHPAYHELMARSAHAGVHNSTWNAEGKPAGGAAEVVRAAKFYMAAQVETGHLCPITMTRASVGGARRAAGSAGEDHAGDRHPRLRSEPSRRGGTKSGMTLGMGMTEKQGGTDVRANITQRRRRDGDAYRDHRP